MKVHILELRRKIRRYAVDHRSYAPVSQRSWVQILFRSDIFFFFQALLSQLLKLCA